MWPFKKKQKQPNLEDQLTALFEKEAKLRREGWINWCYMPPLGYPSVYARRTEQESVDIIEPDKLYPAFNVAGLWWIPHRGEQKLN